MQEHRHSGARALSASPESRNTDQRNQWLGQCSWFPGPPLKGRPGMTRECFSSLLVHRFIQLMQLDVPSALSRRRPGSTFAVGTGFRRCSGV
jgi:hypothetical protein